MTPQPHFLTCAETVAKGGIFRWLNAYNIKVTKKKTLKKTYWQNRNAVVYCLSPRKTEGGWTLKIKQWYNPVNFNKREENSAQKRINWKRNEPDKLRLVSKSLEVYDLSSESYITIFFREFDPGSGWTLAACLTHASRTKMRVWSLRGDDAQT